MPEPSYWMAETSGRLLPDVLAFLNGTDLTPEHVGALRAYCRQWISADIWDLNPHASDEDKACLAELRADVDKLTTRAALSSWLRRATEEGLDPL